MAGDCDYYIGTKKYTEKEFKKYLLEGGYDEFVKAKDIIPQNLKPSTQNENTSNTPDTKGKVAQLEADRDMDVLRERADIGELEFIAEDNLPKEEVDVMRKGEVIGTKKVPNEKLRLQQKEISDKFDRLKQLLGCLTGKKGK